jgi:hypothetical protein
LRWQYILKYIELFINSDNYYKLFIETEIVALPVFNVSNKQMSFWLLVIDLKTPFFFFTFIFSTALFIKQHIIPYVYYVFVCIN